jgi:serine/threonine protein kinase
MSVEIGQNLSHYEILEKLGEGGMGIVYKARDTSLNRLVALKFLPSHLTKDESTRKRFIVEAQAASALDHPNICNIHEINEADDGQLYICMGYYKGESLRQKIKKTTLSVEESLNIFYQIASGLKSAHREKITHRDIKPGNILITEKGEVKIVDFGLAKLAGLELTQSTISKGTVAYMCPEQIRGEKADHRCDIWALGVVFYEMLTGRLPFKGEYPEPMMYSIVNEEPEPLIQHLNNVPDVLQEIINKLLNKDTKERYQSLAELMVDLDSLMKIDEAIVVKKKLAIIKPFFRKKAYLYGGIAILLMIIFLIIGRSYLLPEGRDRNFIAVLPLQNISNETEQEWFTEGMTDILITNLAQIHGLKVISRATAMKYKGTNKSPPEISSELGVQYLVEISAVKMLDQLNVSARLINAPDDAYMWANNYESELKDVLVLFSEAAQDIAREIETELTTEEHEQFAKVKPVNTEAYEFYLKGNYHLNSVNTGNYAALNIAYDYFSKAIELDSTYALAYVGLSHCVGILTFYNEIPLEEGISVGTNLIKKALEIDENLADAYYGYGAYYLWQLWDWEGSRKSFNRGVSINPNLSGLPKAEYLWYLMAMGLFEEAITEGENLLRLDPLSPIARSEVAWTYFYAHKFEKAIELCKRTIELYPENLSTYYDLAISYDQLSNYDEAHQSRLTAMKLAGTDPVKIAQFDNLYTQLGPKAYPTWQLMKQNEGFNNGPTQAAEIYTQLGENEKALEWLEIAYEKHDCALATLNTKPTWDPIRGEPRFQRIIKQMNFPN